jgi:hypothetical protein
MFVAVDRTVDVIWRILYWLAVLGVSLALVVGLILFLESRDQSSLESSDVPARITSPA